ncbi:MAG: hypothetical protein HN348_15270 [Proteobacteria bacterium]|nr:hypothetical protein [Pseudomonadota bacterium]
MNIRSTLAKASATALAIFGLQLGAAEQFDWQKDYATLSPTGGIELNQKAFQFTTGKAVRYIDYESGSDANVGSKAKPWKHHPWDSNANGEAASGGGDTYVFKGGVVYRGILNAKGGGSKGAPLRLTRDPSWGKGDAILAGSQKISGGFAKGAHRQMPDGDKVWKMELDVSPRSLWLVNKDGSSTRIPLARHPNWVSQPEDHKEQWFHWTNKEHPFKPAKGWTADDAKLKGLDKDFVEGAIVYSEFGWVMGTPYPTRLNKFDPNTGMVQFGRWTGGGNAGIIFRNMRYYLEDKPHYLDDPNGEFWVEKKGIGSTLYLRLPGDADPNEAHLEAGHQPVIIEATEAEHIEITGLSFRWAPMYWTLDVGKWDFRTKPWGYRKDATPAAIRVRGEVDSFRVANCNFDHVTKGLELRPQNKGERLIDITIEDNNFRYNDIGAAHFSDGAGWGFANPVGVLDNVKVYRNYCKELGFRAPRYDRGTTFHLGGVRRAHIAGNIIERCGAQAINVLAGKASGMRGEVPLVRIIIQQNKAWKSMQNGNDFGGIETWQHGPVYTFNNISHDARGQQEGKRVINGSTQGFGHAYYLDGGNKNYLFNNIAWGKSNDQTNPLANCSAFQAIHCHQNSYFNNSAWNFVNGSRRQSPVPGRRKFVGNIFQDISDWAFWHWKPAKTDREANANDVGDIGDDVDFGTNVYANNVVNGIGKMGSYLPSGSWLKSFDDFKGALEGTKTIGNLGCEERAAPLRDPGKGDYSLRRGSKAIDMGGKVFVPWSLSAVCAEWNFYPAGTDHTRIIDEHWFARDYMTERKLYHSQPMYPLTAVNVEASDYVDGPLENFTTGALKLDPARKTYAVLSDAKLNMPLVRKQMALQARHFGKDAKKADVTFEGKDLRTAEIYANSFLIEAYFQADSDGLLIGKKSGNGYEVMIKGGKAVFTVEGGGISASVSSKVKVADGKWHHLIVECDRASNKLNIYIDGKISSSAKGVGTASLENAGNLFVGGTDKGDYLSGCIEFMRVSLGTLADAHTTIEELYAWEFNGPQDLDFSGQKIKGSARDAGAIESF